MAGLPARDLLAQPAMQLVASPLDAAADDHTYFSKEAASGGRGDGSSGEELVLP